MPSLYDTNPGIISSNDNITTTLYNTGNAASVPVEVVHPTTLANHTSGANFTTLYNKSNLSAPDAGAGSVTGNLNVSGNLTVQGTSYLIGGVVLGSTLSLPNYSFPLADGVTDQVLTTDGNGNVYWASVASLGLTYQIEADATTGGAHLNLFSNLPSSDKVKFASGTNISVVQTDLSTITINAADQIYNIQADATTGGANLTLTGPGGSTDPVKFASGTNISVVQTDANTITINNSVPLLPVGVKGDVLYYDGTNWTANNKVSADAGIKRFTTSYNNSVAGVNAALFVRKNFGATNFTTGDGPSISFQTESTAQGVSTFSSVGAAYDAADPKFGVSVSTNNYTTKTDIVQLSKGAARFNGTDLALNYNLIGAPTVNANFRVNRGSSADALLTWIESTQNWSFNNTLTVTGALATTGVISTTAESITINSDSSANDSYLYLKGGSVYVKYNNTLGRLETSNGVYVSGELAVGGIIDASGVISTTANAMGVNSGSAAINSYYYFNGATNYIEYDYFNGRFYLSDAVYVNGPATVNGSIGAFGNITTTAEIIGMNSDNTAADSFLRLKGTSVYVKYNNTANNIELSNSLLVNGTATITGDISVDGTVIHIATPVQGQTLIYDGTVFNNSNHFEFTDAVNGRATFINNATPGTSALAALKRETSLVDGQIVGSLMGQIVGTTETYTHRTVSEYDTAGNNIYRVQVDPIGNFATSSTTVTNQLEIDNTTASLAAASVIVNANVTGAPTLNASFIANRGTSPDTSIVWNESTGRWTSTVDGSTFLNLPNQNLDQLSDVTFSSVTIDGISGFNTQVTTTSSVAVTNISATTRRTQKVVIDIVDNVTGEVHVLEALAFQKGGIGYITTYAEMTTSIALANFTADVSGGFIRILATPTSTNSTTFTVVRLGVD